MPKVKQMHRQANIYSQFNNKLLHQKSKNAKRKKEAKKEKYKGMGYRP
jgi:hypothetical protein